MNLRIVGCIFFSVLSWSKQVCVDGVVKEVGWSCTMPHSLLHADPQKDEKILALSTLHDCSHSDEDHAEYAVSWHLFTSAVALHLRRWPQLTSCSHGRCETLTLSYWKVEFSGILADFLQLEVQL